MASHKRRLIPIVDRAFQLKYTALIMGVAAVISAALGYFLLSAYTELNALIDISSEINEQLNADDTRRVFTMVVGFLVLEVLVLGVAGILITHRVVGPITVLHRHLDTLLAGRYPALRPLRAGDEFSSTFDAFGRTVSGLKERDQRELDLLTKAVRAASEKSVDDATLDALRGMIREREARLMAGDARG